MDVNISFFRFFFDDRLWQIMPVAWYLATKLWLYSTWFLYTRKYILLILTFELCDEKTKVQISCVLFVLLCF